MIDFDQTYLDSYRDLVVKGIIETYCIHCEPETCIHKMSIPAMISSLEKRIALKQSGKSDCPVCEILNAPR